MKLLSIESCDLPPNALVNRYAGRGTYTDCFCTELVGQVSHQDFVTAFYTTAVFRMERLVLNLLLSKPSSDSDAIQLAKGDRDLFAAWTVEARDQNQLLLTDYRQLTRSWFMTATSRHGERELTRLYFGSAVMRDDGLDNQKPGMGFSVLIGFHRVYSVMLLYSAKRRLQRDIT